MTSGAAMTSGEALGFLIAPLVAALICALPVLVAAGLADAAAVGALYVVVLGIVPNFALGRRALAWSKARGPLTLGKYIAGAVLTKIAVTFLLTMVGPAVFLALEPATNRAFVLGALATAGAWALPIVGLLGVIEGTVVWIAACRMDRRIV